MKSASDFGSRGAASSEGQDGAFRRPVVVRPAVEVVLPTVSWDGPPGAVAEMVLEALGPAPLAAQNGNGGGEGGAAAFSAEFAGECGHCIEDAHPVYEEEWVHQMTTNLPQDWTCQGEGGHPTHDCENGDGISWSPGTCGDSHDPAESCDGGDPDHDLLTLILNTTRGETLEGTCAPERLRWAHVGATLRVAFHPLEAITDAQD